jgi:CRP-like cAMP-binding protein/HEAT repeat protein/ATP/ADP translocase
MAGMLQTVFKLEKNEIKPAAMIFLMTFLWGTSQMFSYAAANAIFLNVYGASFFSFTFIFNAVLIPLTGMAIMKASERFSFRLHFVGTLVFFVLSLSLLFILLAFTDMKWPAMAYMLWLDIEFAVSGVLFLSLFNKLFNIRQSKRVFGPAGSGTDLSYILMGFVISLIVGVTGVLNLTLFAIGFNLISIFVFIWISISFPEKVGKTDIVIKEEMDSSEKITLRDLFRKRFVVLIIALGSIYSACFCFGTNLYLVQTEQFLNDEKKIAAFIALYYSVSSMILLFVKGFLTSRIIRNFGMTFSLLLTPLLIGLSTLVFTALIRFPISPFMVFLLVVNIYLMQTVFGTSIHKSSFFSLIQSLPAGETDKVINLSETIVPSLVNGIAGAILLVMMQVFKAGPGALAIGILIASTVWFLIAFLLGKEYKKNLKDILKDRFGKDTGIALDNPEILKSILSGLESSYPQEVIYSIEMLQKAGIPDLKARVIELARSETPSVRKKVFEIFEATGNQEDLRFLSSCLEQEKEGENVAVLLNAIASSSEGGEIDTIESYLHHGDKVISMAAFTALIRHCGIEGVMKAGSELLGKANSSDSQDRQFTAETIGDIGSANLYKLLIPLMKDSDPDVRRKAFEAAGSIKNPKLVPFMVRSLNDDASRQVIMRGLIGFSHTAFPALEEIYRTESDSRKLIAYLYGRIKGEEAVRNLCRKLKEDELDVLTEILNSLELCNFRMDRKDLEEFEKLLEKMIGFGILLRAARKDIEKGILADALDNEIRKNKLRIFSLIFILHPDSNIKDIRFNYFFGRTEEKNALVIELLDNILPRKYKLSVLSILEDTGDLPDRTRRDFPRKPLGYEGRIDEIIRDKSTWQNVWLRASAYFTRLKSVSEVDDRKAFLLDMMKKEAQRVSELILPYQGKDGERKPSLIKTILFIRRSEIFSGIEDESLVEIARRVKMIRYAANSRIFNKNDDGAQLYILVDGKVRIHDGERTIAELNNGEIFGEFSAFSPEKRSASATAMTDTALFSISQSDIFSIIDDRIEVAMGIIAVLCARLRKTLAGGVYKTYGAPDQTVIPAPGLPDPKRSLTTIERMMVLKTVSIFSTIPDAILKDLADLSKQQFIPSGQVLFNKGDTGTSMAVIVSGKMRIHDGEKTIAVLEDRQIIGELAALSSESRTATVTAVEDTVLLKLTQEVVYEMMWDQRDIVKEFIVVLVERLRTKI